MIARLQGLGIEEVRTSEIERAVETAEIVAAGLRIPLVRDARLNEMLLGPWEGLTEREVEARYPEAYALWSSRPHELVIEGRETLECLARRITLVVREMAARPFPLLLMTHVAPMRVAALETLGLSLARYKSISVPNAEVFRIDRTLRKVHRLEGASCLKEELARSEDAA